MRNRPGMLPKKYTSTANSSKLTSTNTPMRKRSFFSLMESSWRAGGVNPPRRTTRAVHTPRSPLSRGLRQLAQSLAGLALDKLTHARLVALAQFVGGALEQHLRL